MSKFDTSTALVITALSNAINDEGDDNVCAVRVTVYVSSCRFEKEARTSEPGSTRGVLGLPLVVGLKLTAKEARVAFP